MNRMKDALLHAAALMRRGRQRAVAYLPSPVQSIQKRMGFPNVQPNQSTPIQQPQGHGMKHRSTSLLTLLHSWCATAALSIGLTACSALPATGADSWKEEVLLHDGQKIMLERSQTYRGNTEPGQHPPVGTQTLRFSAPGGRGVLVWSSDFSPDIGRTDFNPLAIHVKDGLVYVITTPNLCLSYNKWGRPNPPYVVFRQSGSEWQRITMEELPVEFKTINLLQNDNQWAIKEKSQGKGYLSADEVVSMNAVLRQPELKTILREGTKSSVSGCPQLVFYKGAWVGPGDSIGKRMQDSKSK